MNITYTVCNHLINEGKDVVNYSFQENEVYYLLEHRRLF